MLGYTGVDGEASLSDGQYKSGKINGAGRGGIFRLTFWRNVSPPSSGLKSKPSRKLADTGRKLSLLLNPEDRGDMFLHSVRPSAN
jgi:hypothetical protein